MKARKTTDGRWLADLRFQGEGPRLICPTKKDADAIVAQAKERLVRERLLPPAVDHLL